MWLRRRCAADLVLASGCVLAGGWDGLRSGLFDGSPVLGLQAPPGVDLALGGLAGLAVLARRERPLVLYAAALLGWLVSAAYPAVLVAQYTLGAHRRSPREGAALTAASVAVVVGPIWGAYGGDAGVPLAVTLCVLPFLIGLTLRSHRAQVAELRERARRNRREEQLRIDRARAEERAQIARDMHDVVTHRVSLMVLHATALEAARGRDAVAVSAQIQGIGRAALEELRSLVGVLRDGAAAPLRPQPGLADLPELTDASRALGVAVDLRMPAGLRAPALAEHAVYRVVQEALTNVHKHTAGARASVTVGADEAGLAVVVTNGAGPGGSGGTGSAMPFAATGAGHGLLGIAERVRLVGGTLSARPLAGGGFEVSAHVPVDRGALP